MPKIELQNVTKRFGRIFALKKVNLTINDGEYVVILGPSGCGKTTLLNIIAGIWKPTTGKVFLDGKDVTDVPLEERHLSFVFQNIALFPHLNVWENVTYSPFVRGFPAKKQNQIGNQILGLVELEEKKNELPQNLSSGFQQKAALARALSTEAKLMILDEPLSALDPAVRVELRTKIRKLVKELGITAVHVTHDQDEAMSVADKIILMRKGEIVNVATPQEMYNTPKSLFEGYFIGQANFIEGYVQAQDDTSFTINLRREKMIKIKKQPFYPEFDAGEPVVLFCRPENTLILPKKTDNTIGGKIKRRIFMGSYYRYEILSFTEDLILADAPLSQKILPINTQIYVRFKPNGIILFKEPKYGLKEELQLE